MSKINSEFILGSAVAYFFSNNYLVFTLGVATGVIIQEKFGSVYRFSQFCYDSSIKIINNNFSKLFGKNVNKKNDNKLVDNDIDIHNSNIAEDNNTIIDSNSLKNKEL
jgi:hypothetical protein